MSVLDNLKGYQYDFIDGVPEDLYCKKCILVARRLTITNCCGESFCHACIADTQEEGKPCPECGEKEYTTVGHIKNQKKVYGLQVYCIMKEKGCDWSGTLKQLETHLDPDQDNCQYVDTKCPLNCHMTIPKNKVEQHVAQHCAKRPYVCQYCNFKATYENVVNIHFPQCKYVPLQCPNLCGVTFERDFMEDHMKMCRLEEVACKFSSVGCDDQFRREDQEEHTRQNSRKHLTLTASLAVETNEQLQQKLLEQDKKHEEEEEKLKQNIKEQMEKLLEVGQKLLEQKQMLKKQKLQVQQQNTVNQGMKKHLVEKIDAQQLKIIEQNNLQTKQKQQLKEQDKKLQDLEEKLEEQETLRQEINSKLSDLEQVIQTMQSQNGAKMLQLSNFVMKRTFIMNNFTSERAKDVISDWKTDDTYTHIGGYKFCIGLDANGWGEGRGKYISIDAWSVPGEYDHLLKWPTKAVFTIELINQQGGKNVSYTSGAVTWNKPKKSYETMAVFSRISVGSSYAFLEQSKLSNFLLNDALYIHISKIDLL